MRAWAVASTLLGLLAGEPACAPAAVGPAPALPVFSPADAALFDDTFSVDIFESAAVEPEESPEKLIERVVLADSVFPARISTITRDVVGNTRSYGLTLKPTGPALAGAAVTEPLMIAVTADSPSFVRVRGAETTLVGKTLILFFRRYDLGDGTEIVHWRAESDSEAVRAAISQATAVRAARARE